MHAILGINCFSHDTSAALLVDDQLVAFGEEERFNRESHTGSFPHQSVASVLRQGGIDISDVSYVAFAHRPQDDLRRGALDALKRRAPRRLLAQAVVDGRLASRSQLFRRTWGYRGPLLFVPHHVAHAAGTYFSSPFDGAAVLTLDRGGDFVSTTASVGRDNVLDLVREIRNPDSLGEVYTAVSSFLGFRPQDEGRVTGLAPYGTATYVDGLRDLITLQPDGGFSVNLEWFGYHAGGPPVSGAFVERYGRPRLPGTEITDRDKDVAHALQDLTEEAVLHVARALRRSTSSVNLCLSGGVALNPLINTRVLDEAGFDDIWIQPVSGDAGNAIGAALWVCHGHLGRPRSWRMADARCGESWSDLDCATALRRAGLPADRVESPASEAARRLAESKVVGWFQGRAEAGPQALGSRSLLADPRAATTRDRVNRRVTDREWFRPLASSVLHERGAELLDRYHLSPFKQYVLPVRDSMQAVIPAATHVDGTARVQSVRRHPDPDLHELLVQFDALTGVPAVVHTGFSPPGEPMVHRPGEAVAEYLRSDMDSLVLGPYVVDKPAA